MTAVSVERLPTLAPPIAKMEVPMSRKERRERRKRERAERAEKDPFEPLVDAVLRRERTAQPNEEGYHFVRPAWHRIVYGGGKQTQ